MCSSDLGLSYFAITGEPVKEAPAQQPVVEESAEQPKEELPVTIPIPSQEEIQKPVRIPLEPASVPDYLYALVVLIIVVVLGWFYYHGHHHVKKLVKTSRK